jgi:hypothetical protein
MNVEQDLGQKTPLTFNTQGKNQKSSRRKNARTLSFEQNQFIQGKFTLKDKPKITHIKAKPLGINERVLSILREIENYQTYKSDFLKWGKDAFPDEIEYMQILDTFGKEAVIQQALKTHSMEEKNENGSLELDYLINIIENSGENREKQLKSFIKILSIYEQHLKHNNQSSQTFLEEINKERYKDHLKRFHELMFALKCSPNIQFDIYKEALEEFKKQKKILKMALAALVNWSLSNSEDPKIQSLQQIDDTKAAFAVQCFLIEKGHELIPIPFEKIFDLVSKNLQMKEVSIKNKTPKFSRRHLRVQKMPLEKIEPAPKKENFDEVASLKKKVKDLDYLNFNLYLYGEKKT